MEEIKPTSLFTSLAEAVKFGARLHAARTGELPSELPSQRPSQLPSPKQDAALEFCQLPSPTLDAVLGLGQQPGPGAGQATTNDTGPLHLSSQPGSLSDMDIAAARDEEVGILSRSSSLTHAKMTSAIARSSSLTHAEMTSAIARASSLTHAEMTCAAAARSSITSSCRAVEMLPHASFGSVAVPAPSEAALGTPARGTPPPCPAPLDDAPRAQDPSSEAELSRSESVGNFAALPPSPGLNLMMSGDG